jgi:hemerythrin
MTIHWREAMSVDGALIDEDHRHLIDIINTFERQASGFTEADEVLEILHVLKFYTRTHFRREEHLQRVVDFPFKDAHGKEHADIIGKLNAVIEETRSCEGRALMGLTANISLLLRDWILGHVLKSDLRMKEYVDRMERELSQMERLDEIPVGVE